MYGTGEENDLLNNHKLFHFSVDHFFISYNFYVKPLLLFDWSSSVINPFAPELPVTARADAGPFYPLRRQQF